MNATRCNICGIVRICNLGRAQAARVRPRAASLEAVVESRVENDIALRIFGDDGALSAHVIAAHEVA